MRKHVVLIQTWWVDRIAAGVSEFASKNDWSVDFRMRWDRKVPNLNHWQGDGIIAFVGEIAPDPKAVHFIRNAGVPVVDLGAYNDHFKTYHVFCVDEERGRLAAAHLHALGLRHFAFVRDKVSNPYEEHRQIGFCEEIKRIGGSLTIIQLEELAKLLPDLPRPLGFFTAHDLFSLEVMACCKQGGYLVPEEFAILGCDDTELLCNFAPISLSSVNCNQESVGYTAAQVLHQLMNGKTPDEKIFKIRPKSVTVRASTDTIAMPNVAAAQVLTYLRLNFRKTVTLSEITANKNVSPRKLQMLFLEATGHTMVQELTRLRINEAKRLLRETKWNIEKIAFESGFKSRAYFINVFKKRIGVSPTDYRKKINTQVLSSHLSE